MYRNITCEKKFLMFNIRSLKSYYGWKKKSYYGWKTLFGKGCLGVLKPKKKTLKFTTFKVKMANEVKNKL